MEKKEILLNIPSGKFACENEAELVERDPKLKNPGACICWRWPFPGVCPGDNLKMPAPVREIK